MGILLTLVTLAAGCTAGPVSADTGPEPSATPSPTAASSAPGHTADDVVLRVSQTGGFAGPPSVPPPPPVTVYADGTMLTIDRPSGTAATPGVARLSRRQLTQPALGRLLYLAAKAGLADRDHLDKPIPDAIVTVIAVRHGGRLNHSTFATFSPRPEDSPDEAQRRANAARFVRRLQNDPSTLMPSGMSDPTPVPVDRLAMSATALAPPALPERDWPVATVDLSTLGPCTVVRGADAQQAADALIEAPGGTRWGWQAQAWRVLAAPPVEDQPDCEPAAA